MLRKPASWLARTAVFLLLLTANCLSMNAQISQRVHGTVTSATDGMPLIGVNVVEKGTTNGAITDIDGNYSLNVSVGSELEFSYIGFIS